MYYGHHSTLVFWVAFARPTRGRTSSAMARTSGVVVTLERSSTTRVRIHMMAMILSAGTMPGQSLARRPRRQVHRRRMTPRAVKKRVTHERILKSADKIARREGLRAASVPRVMKGAGLTIGGFYAHFPSKTAMDVEIIRSILGDVP